MGKSEFDTAYPIWAEVVHTSGPSGGGGGGDTARGDVSLLSISKALGWRVNKKDPLGIRRAIDEAFLLERSPDGHTTVTWRDRGLGLQTGSSGVAQVSGAQLSLYKRAKAIVDQVHPLLDGLVGLDRCIDREDFDSVLSMIRPPLAEIVEQLGAEGGPVPQRIDNALQLLIGYDPRTSTTTAFVDAATVGGHLGTLRNVLGLTREHVNSVNEELSLTNFHTLVNYIDMLRLTWHMQRGAFGRTNTDAYLGTQTVLIERALGCITESVQEVIRSLDSVFIGPLERSSITLDVSGTKMTIAELLAWTDDVASRQGFDAIASGKDGVIHALVPTLTNLDATMQAALATMKRDKALPKGVRTARVRAMFGELADHVANALRLSRAIRRFEAPEIDLERTAVQVTAAPGSKEFRLEIRGNHFRPDARLEITDGAKTTSIADVVWNGEGQLAALVPREAMNGSTVRVINPDGQASKDVRIPKLT